MYHSRKLPVLIQTPVRLPKRSADNSSAEAAAKQGRLCITSPDMPARHTRLDKQVLTIGRSRRNDIVLSDENISSHHARLHQTNGGWQVEALAGDAGTLLNGRELSPNSPQNWSPNQPLQIAGYTLQWALPANGAAAIAPPVAAEDGRVAVSSRPLPFLATALILIWLLVLTGVPVYLPPLLASSLTFTALLITPGFLLADIVARRLGLDKLEQLALAMPLGIAVLALAGMAALLLHLTITDLALGWFIVSALVVAVWLLGQSGISVFGRLFRTSPSLPIRPSLPWAIDEILLLLFLIALFVFIFPALSLDKIDGDALAVNTFAVDALAGLPLNAKEPLFGTDLGSGVRMVFNQYLPLSYLWSYLAGLDSIALMSLFSRQILALWAVLAMYMLGKAAGDDSRRLGLVTAAIQLLIYAAAPFWRGDNVSLYFFERINADKFLVMALLLPPCFALAIRFVRNGRIGTWLAAAVVAFAASTIHPLSAAMLALALGAFGGCHLLLNLRHRPAWKRGLGLAVLAAVVMLLPIVQLFLSRGEAPLAPSYPNSFEGWALGEEMTPILPFVNIPALDYYGPLPQLEQLAAEQAYSDTNPFLIWRFAVNMERQRLVVFDVDHFISDPRLLLELPYLLALLSLPLLIWRLRRNPAVQFAVSTTLAILFVMFNPFVTPLIGSLVMPWILWRLVWLLPYPLIIALAAQQILAPKAGTSEAAVKREPPPRRWLGVTIPGRSELAQGAYLLPAAVLIIGLLAGPAIRSHMQYLQYDAASSYFYPAPQRIFDHLNAQISIDEPVMVLADQDLSVTVAAYVAHANILAHRVPTTSEIFPADQQDIALQRLIDQNAFFRMSYLTADSINILSRYGVKYIITSSGSDLDLQLQLAPEWFQWQLNDHSYSLYAVVDIPSETAVTLQGNDALAKRDWAAAEAHYETALGQNPGDLLAMAGLAEIAQQQGRFEEASGWWRLALSRTDLPILHARLGQLYALRGDFEGSITEWEQAVQQAPEVGRYHVGLGDACLYSGLDNCAEEQYAAAVAQRSLPDEAARLMLEANLWQQQGRFDKAIPLYEQAVALQPVPFNQYVLESAYHEAGQPEKAEALLQSLRTESPFSAELAVVTANMLTTMNRFEEAAEQYRSAIRLEQFQAQDTIDTRLALAQLLLDAGLLAEAEQEIETTLALAPYHGEAHRLQGDLYRLQGEFDEAAELYEQAFLLDPNDVTIYVSLNNQLRQHDGRPEDWLQILQTAVSLNPNEPSLHLALGDHWRQQGNRAAAINAYLSALENLEPDALPGQFLPPAGRQGRAFVYSHLARIYEDQGQTNTALNYYHAMTAVAPDAPWTQIVLGDAWRRQNDVERAENLYEQALETDPNYLIAYLRLAEINDARGDGDEAAALQQQAMQLAESQLTRPLQDQELSQSGQLLFLPALPSFSDAAPLLEAADTDSGDNLIQQLQLAEEQVATLGLLTHLYQLSGQSDRAIELYQGRLALSEQNGGSPALQAQYHKGLGDLYFSQGQLDSAVDAYRQAIALDQWWPEARMGLATTFMAQNKGEAALTQLQTAFDLTPGVMEVRLALADALLQQGRLDEAQVVYEAAVEDYPANARAMQALAEFYESHRRPLAALPLYEQALARDPENATLYLALSRIRLGQGDAVQAQAVLESGLNVVSDATDLSTALSTLFLEQNKPEEALAILRQGIGQEGENTPLLLALAAYYTSRANYDQAAEWHQYALSLAPDSAAIRVAMADLALHLGNVNEALSHYEQAVELAPAAPRYRLALANAFQSNGRYDEAVAAYTQTITIEPELTAAYIGLADVFRAQERWDEAQSTYEQGLAATPTSAWLLSVYAGFMLDRGDEAQSLVLLQQAAEHVQDVPTMVIIAGLYDELGRPEQGEALLETALAQEPGSILALIGLGDLYERQGRTDEAQLLYEKMVALTPGLPIGYLRLGNLANLAGDQTAADEYAALAQQVAPGAFGP